MTTPTLRSESKATTRFGWPSPHLTIVIRDGQVVTETWDPSPRTLTNGDVFHVTVIQEFPCND